MSDLRQSPDYVELINRAKDEGAEQVATLLTHVGWNKPDGYLTIHKGTTAVGRQALAAIGCPDIGPTGLPLREVLNRVARLAADRDHARLAGAISEYAAHVWSGETPSPSPTLGGAGETTQQVASDWALPVRSARVALGIGVQGRDRGQGQALDVERAVGWLAWLDASHAGGLASANLSNEIARAATGFYAKYGLAISEGTVPSQEFVTRCIDVLELAGVEADLISRLREHYRVPRGTGEGNGAGPAILTDDENPSSHRTANELHVDWPRPPETADLIKDSLAAESGPATARPVASDRVEFVPPEISEVIEYPVSPRSGEKARREESQLVKRFESWLTSRGHRIERAKIRPIGESSYLFTDTYDVDSKILYEAKSSSDRATVRLAVGQLLDYLRFLPEAGGAVLLPDEPTYDLQKFVAACGLGLTYPSEGGWIELSPPHGDDELGKSTAVD